MSFHDSLAEGALRDGNTPDQFRNAAQRHANAFWFYVAIGGGVWYFFGWGWSLLPFGLAALTGMQSVSSTRLAGKLEQRLIHAPAPLEFDLSDPSDVLLIDKIREQYSALLADESGPYAGCIYRPTVLLPYPKEVIRHALTTLLDFVEGHRDSDLLDPSIQRPEVSEMIRTALVSLEEFIDVAPQDLPTNPTENARVGLRLQR